MDKSIYFIFIGVLVSSMLLFGGRQVAQSSCAKVEITVPTTTVKAGQLVTFNVNTKEKGVKEWYWEFGDEGALNMAYTKTANHIYTVPGTYTVTLTTNNLLACSKTIDIKVTDGRTLAIGAPVKTITGAPVSLTAPSGFGKYAWNFGDGISDTAANPQHVYNIPGNYKVTLTLDGKEKLQHQIAVAIASGDTIWFDNKKEWYLGETVVLVGDNISPNGFGTYKYANNEYYSGNWVNATRYGIGVLYFENGAKKQEGSWISDRLEGQGTLYVKTSNGQSVKSYVGALKNGKPEGKGISYFASGKERYNGEWRSGEFEGKGTLYYTSGNEQYEGEWKRGKRHGDGAAYTDSGNVTFEGEWANDKPASGSGKEFKEGVLVYEGEFRNGDWHGNGTRYFNDSQFRNTQYYKRKWVGTFANGKMHGEGKVFGADGVFLFNLRYNNGIAQ